MAQPSIHRLTHAARLERVDGGATSASWSPAAAANAARLAVAYLSTSVSYALTVFPAARRELAGWCVRARQIPDPELCRLALSALAKRGNMHGAALFAVFAPRAHRAATIRALVAFQAAYNYLDTLSEQPSRDPVANSRRLHAALVGALELSAQPRDHHARNPQCEDAGYLQEMLEACRSSLETLPAYPLVARSAQAAAARIVEFQSLNLHEPQDGPTDLELWAGEQGPRECDLTWWELAGAAGSSLGVHVLIGLSAQRALDSAEVAAVDAAYFPAIGALHSLLDSAIDLAEDERDGRSSLLENYATQAQAAERLGLLTRHARAATRRLSAGYRHEVILTAMICHYLSDPEAGAPRARAIAGSVAGVAGPVARPALAAFRARRKLIRA